MDSALYKRGVCLLVFRCTPHSMKILFSELCKNSLEGILGVCETIWGVFGGHIGYALSEFRPATIQKIQTTANTLFFTIQNYVQIVRVYSRVFNTWSACPDFWPNCWPDVLPDFWPWDKILCTDQLDRAIQFYSTTGTENIQFYRTTGMEKVGGKDHALKIPSY